MSSHPAIRWRAALLAENEQNDLPPTARLVGLALAQHVNRDTAEAYPSAARLSERTGLSDRAVRAHLATLEQQGWLRRVRQGGVKGGTRMTIWKVITPAPDAEVTPAQDADINAATPANDALTSANDDHDPGISFTRTREELDELGERERPLAESLVKRNKDEVQPLLAGLRATHGHLVDDAVQLLLDDSAGFSFPSQLTAAVVAMVDKSKRRATQVALEQPGSVAWRPGQQPPKERPRSEGEYLHDKGQRRAHLEAIKAAIA